MLVITIELQAGGDTRRRSLGTMMIGNVSGLADLSDYEISASEGANPIAGTAARTCRARLEGHDRRQLVDRGGRRRCSHPGGRRLGRLVTIATRTSAGDCEMRG